jgi:DNA-binding beta-propeller fold protein YncE
MTKTNGWARPVAWISATMLAALGGCDPAPATPDAAMPEADAFAADDAPLGMADAFSPDDAAMPPVDAFVPPASARTTPTQGGAIVLSSDDAIAVATNRQAGTVSVLAVTGGATPSVARTALLDVAGREPWAAIVGNDDDTAYVVLRESHEVARIRSLRTAPVLDATRVSTGSEPTGIAISPTGRFLYVPCWAEGTVTMIDTATFTVARTIDLNDDLVATGMLGTVAARPGLAHPRAIVVTNDGDTDDADETVWVTEYFGQHRTSGLPADDTAFDLAREGLVYRFGAGDGAGLDPVRLAPVADTGFLDSNGATTGCFPNQLQTAALAQGRLYVTGVCASPRGPTGPVIDTGTGLPVAEARGTANFKTEVHTSIFVVDPVAGAELPAQRVLLPRAFQSRYDAMSVPDDATRRIPLIATDLAFVPESGIGYLTSYGSDAVFRVSFAADGSLREVGATANHFINLVPAAGPAAGRLPIGLAIASAGGLALALNEATRNVSVITLGTQSVVAAAEASPMPTAGSHEADVLDGRRFFVTGLGRWSFRGQGWNSCEACHGDGLTDNVTWFFARGPRQSTSLDGSFDSADPSAQRVFNWTAIFDETHDFELNTRGNSGGLGAVVDEVSTPPVVADRIHFDGTTPVPAGQTPTSTPQAGLNGSLRAMMPGGPGAPGASGTVRATLADWDHVEAYIQTIRSPRAPVGLDAALVTAGRTLFEANHCAGCHGTAMWTTSRVFWTPGETANAAAGTLRTTTYTAPSMFPAALNPPTAGAGRTASLRFPAGATAGANDQIQCVLRAVGTFPATGTAPILPAGSPMAIREVRTNMTADAQGLSGFNPPSLLGGVTGAPYFHAGNARTLEELFDPAFEAHYQALSENFLLAGDRDLQVRQLVAFLLSIDEGTTPAPAPALGYPFQLCPDSL